MKSFTYLPPHTVTLHGILGTTLDNTIANRLLRINYKFLVDPFRLRNEMDGRWRCEFWGKIVRSAILALHAKYDPVLEKTVRKTVKDILSTQTPDGCISSYPQEKHLESWDIWGRKYVMIGLIRYYDEIEQDPKIANALERLLDNLIRELDGRALNTFGMHYGLAACSILNAVVGVYRITGKKRFLDFAREIVESGCCTKHNIFDEVRKGTPPARISNGKAYEMMSCFQGLADFCKYEPEKKYLESSEKFFEAVRRQEIFVTGGAGTKDLVGELWNFGKKKQTRTDAGALGETCVTVTYQHYCDAILRLDASPEAALESTHTFCNALLGAVSRDGRSWCHANPTPLAGPSSKIPAGDQMTGQGVEPFHGHDCCLAQGPEGVALAVMHTAMRSGKGIVLNYFEAMDLDLEGTAPGKLHISGKYPFAGKIAIKFELEKSSSFRISLLIPAWQKKPFSVRVCGKKVKAQPGTYLALDRTWKDGDTIEFELDFSLRLLRSPDKKFVSFMAGPLVLARDSRLGDVNTPVPTDLVSEEIKPKKDSHLRLVRELSDGTRLCDYLSAGNFFAAGNLLRVWLEPKDEIKQPAGR